MVEIVFYSFRSKTVRAHWFDLDTILPWKQTGKNGFWVPTTELNFK